MMMALFKIARESTGVGKQDNVRDSLGSLARYVSIHAPAGGGCDKGDREEVDRVKHMEDIRARTCVRLPLRLHNACP